MTLERPILRVGRRGQLALRVHWHSHILRLFTPPSPRPTTITSSLFKALPTIQGLSISWPFRQHFTAERNTLLIVIRSERERDLCWTTPGVIPDMALHHEDMAWNLSN